MASDQQRDERIVDTPFVTQKSARNADSCN
jgi:hypothetical protein